MKSMLIRLAIVIAFMLVGVSWFFFHEIGLKISDTASSVFSESSQPTWLDESKTPLIIGYRLISGRNDASQVSIESLQAGVPVGGKVDIQFQLINHGEADFPWLRVYFIDAKGKTVRTSAIPPTAYSHSGTFSREQINLTLVVRDSEARFTVAPFFPN
jgi:hypothetical protein